MNSRALPKPSSQRFWWVNQNQTFRQEIDGGYLWSPKRKSNGHRNAFDRPEYLLASHCKPWRECDNSAERLDGENGLMLTPTIDHLFDRGFISFENNGSLLISPVADMGSMEKMGIDVSGRLNVGAFSDGQQDYLDFHRDAVFLCSQTGR